MADAHIMYWLTGLAIFVSIAIAVVGGLLNRIWRELQDKVPRGEYEEYRNNMREQCNHTVNHLQEKLDQGQGNFNKIDKQLGSINMILMAVAVKLNVTDVDKVIESQMKEGMGIS